MKAHLNLIRLVAEGLLLILVIAYYFKHKDLKAHDETIQSVLNEKSAHIEVIELRNGKLKQEKETAILQASHAQEAVKYFKEEIKDLEKNHDVKLKQLHTYYRAKMETTGSGSVTLRDTLIVGPDSTIHHYPTVKINDGYLSLNGFFTQDRFDYKYSVTDSLSVAYYWTYKGLWPFRKKDKLKISFSSQNPNTRLSSVTSLVIDEGKKKTRFSVGPYVGYGISSKGTSSVQVGLGIQFSLLRIRM